MNVTDYLNKVAYVADMGIFKDDPSKVYLSRFDDSYIAHVDMEDNIKYLAEREITDELTHGVGFSPLDGKWYGWSHRAIYGFEIGSECKKGDCHYAGSTPEELIDDHANFFLDISKDSADQKRAECQILDDRSGIRILHTPITMHVAPSIEGAEQAVSDGTISDLPEETIDSGFSIVRCGRGEWTAETMEDAKQMAKDFNECVS